MHRMYFTILFLALMVSLGFAHFTTANGYVRVDVIETSGEFAVGGDPTGSGDYINLTYDFSDSYPLDYTIGWIMYNIDGTFAKTEDELPECSSYMSGDTIISIRDDWGGVSIRQEIIPVSLGIIPGESEQIKCLRPFLNR